MGQRPLMKCTLFALLALAVIAPTFAREPAPDVTFVSPCECIAFHGIYRWVAKTDLTPVPRDQSAIQAITPSQIYAWEGLAPDVDMTEYTEARLPNGMGLRTASLTRKWKQTAIFTLRFKTPTARTAELSVPKFHLAQSGVSFDIAHAPADHSNRRHSPKDYAMWEIHPVMKLEVVQ